MTTPTRMMKPRPIVMQFSDYSLKRLRVDPEFVLLYGSHANGIDPPSVLLLCAASTRPGPETRKKIDREYSLRSKLDSAWTRNS